MADWQADKAWADGWTPVIRAILKSVAMEALSITVAPDEKDQRFATDYIIQVPQGDIACRLRRLATCPGIPDFTLRASRPSGVKTELAKIREGFAAWYLYGWIEPHTPAVQNYTDWINGPDQLRRWVFIDLTMCRARAIFDAAWDRTKNTDGTTFIAIPLRALDDIGAIYRMSRPLDQLRPLWE